MIVQCCIKEISTKLQPIAKKHNRSILNRLNQHRSHGPIFFQLKEEPEDYAGKQKKEKESSENKNKDAKDKVEKSRKSDAKVKNKTRKARISSDEDDEMVEKDEAKSGRRHERMKSSDRSNNQVPK